MNFIMDYATVQLGSGVHTSRVARNAHRIGKALGVDVNLSTFQKNAVISINDKEDELQITRVVPIPTLPISFQLNSSLSALSWEAEDENLELEELQQRFASYTEKPPLSILIVTLAVALANASFCRLFGGDFWAMIVVFIATLAGFSLKQGLSRLNISNYIVVTLSSFLASAIATLSLHLNCNANIAIATSPLFLVPGVPLINGFIDIVEGYTLIGMSRLINALLIIICIALGLSITLTLFNIPFPNFC